MNKGLELYKHNEEAYKKIEKAYTRGENVVGIVHATGTGKSYLALNLAYHNQDKKIVYLVPSNGIIEHLKNIIKDSNLDINDFKHVEFRTYQSLVNLSLEEIKEIDSDMLILDEFHHLGAPIWGKRINAFIKIHPGIKIFGMTAYTIRDRNTSYERDMANPDGNELFSNKIVSRYDLCDAIIDGILPQNITYKTSIVNLEEILNKLDKKTNSLGTEENKKELEIARKRISEAPNISKIIKENIHSNSKLIYFCPPFSEKGVNDIETIKKEAMEWFKQITNEENIVFYSTTSDMGLDGVKNRDAFYHDVDLNGIDVSNKLRVMFAINQYNEGIHAPNVDGVIMGRGTSSDIVFFEQLGRALAVNNNGSPIIIDLAGNFTYMNELENNIKNRIKERKISTGRTNDRKNIQNIKFNIEIQNIDIFNFLSDYYKKINRTWMDYYVLAKKYYESYGNLEISAKFKTDDGTNRNDNGKVNLGIWIAKQRRNCSPKSERGKLLSQIGMRFENIKSTLSWDEMYEYAKKYYESYGNLEVPYKFKTTDGINYNENGKIKLGIWIFNQRQTCSFESERGKLLRQIGMRFESKNLNKVWLEMYEYAKKYYESHGNLEVPYNFKTTDGINYKENGKINLGIWIFNQRQTCSFESERGKLLSQIGMRFENIKSTLSWDKMYEYAKKYYETYGNLEIPNRFKTTDGINYDENGKINLGIWIFNQRTSCLPNSEYGKLLGNIGMRFNKLSEYNQLKLLFLEYDIDLEQNKYILLTSYPEEFLAKLRLCEELKLEIKDKDNKLNKIFYMTNDDFKNTLGFSVDELIDKYNLDGIHSKNK